MLIAAAVILILILLSLLAGLVLVRMTFTRGHFDPYTHPPTDPEFLTHDKNAKAGERWLKSMKPEECEIRSFDGLTLRALFLPAEVPTDRTILCEHGYHCYGSYEFGNISRRLHEMGCNLLIPDDRAHGRSEGRVIGFGNLDARDCVSWCGYLVQRFGSGARIALYGVSMGAAAVLTASGREDLPRQVRGVAADCGFSSGWREVCAVCRRDFHLPSFPFVYAGDLWLKLLAGYSLRKDNPIDMVKKAKVPILILHGDQDTFVPTDMGKELFEAIPGEKRLKIIKGARHAQSYDTDPEGYAKAFQELLTLAGM